MVVSFNPSQFINYGSGMLMSSYGGAGQSIISGLVKTLGRLIAMHWNEPRFRPNIAAGMRTLITFALGLCAAVLAMPAANASPPP